MCCGGARATVGDAEYERFSGGEQGWRLRAAKWREASSSAKRKEGTLSADARLGFPHSHMRLERLQLYKKLRRIPSGRHIPRTEACPGEPPFGDALDRREGLNGG